jgi:hypothetical protein
MDALDVRVLGGNPTKPLGGDIMLYESTKSLLQSIVRSLEAGDRNGWDDRSESGKTCLYEMHQMSKPLYKGYKSDRVGGDVAQNGISGMLNRALPHVRLMVIAIRQKDQRRAVESGRAALAEMNGGSHSKEPGRRATKEFSNGLPPRKKAIEQVDFSARKSHKGSRRSRVVSTRARPPAPRRGV